MRDVVVYQNKAAKREPLGFTEIHPITDVDCGFPLERYLRRLSPTAASVLITGFVLGAWALGAFIDGVTL